MKRIAIQGVAGAFHEIAAYKYFHNEQVQCLYCNTFEEVFDSINNDPTIIGLVAIENTIAGSLLHNYELLPLLENINSILNMQYVAYQRTIGTHCKKCTLILLP